ncbi:MAG: DNA replication/repair protein RecF [Pseudomonadota bacterium]
MSAYFTRLRLNGFRNYTSLDLRLDGRHAVLTGPNGSGKTNLIEAVSLFSPGRGLRRALTSDLSSKKVGDGAFSIFAELNAADDIFEIGTGVQPSLTASDGTQSRKVRINGTTAKSSDELLQLCRIVWLTPAMDGLFTGPASDRRRFLDRLVLAIDPEHGKRANAFERTLRQRNRLLEESSGSLHNNQWLDAIEAQLASLAIGMQAARSEMVGLLAGAAAQESDGEFPRSELGLTGEMEDLVSESAGEGAAATEAAYLDMLKNMRFRDQAARRTLIGPHRSDVSVRHIQKDMPAGLCSTGEQKALLVGLILAHCALTKAVSRHAPIMLFDEIAAHLDSDRRAALFSRIDLIGGQAFMTGTDASLFDALEDRGQRFHVSAGEVFPNG